MAKKDIGFGSLNLNSFETGKTRYQDMIREATSAVEDIVGNGATVEFSMILYDDLVRYERNRSNDQNVDELVNGILSNGFITNLTVRKILIGGVTKYQILSGHRRWKAFGEVLKIKPEFNNRKVPCLIVPAETTDNQAREINLRLNLDAEDLTPREKREAILELISMYENDKGELSREAAELAAKKLNKTAVTIYNYRKVRNNLIPELAAFLNDGSITDAEALEYCRLKESNQVLVFNTLIGKDAKSGRLKLEPEELNSIKETDRAERDDERSQKKAVEELQKELSLAQKTRGENDEQRVEELQQQLADSRRELELLKRRENEAKARNREARNVIKTARRSVRDQTATSEDIQNVSIATNSYINDVARKIALLGKNIVGLQLEEEQIVQIRILANQLLKMAENGCDAFSAVEENN